MIDPEENVSLGDAKTEVWTKIYREQREHREVQLRQIASFAEGASCRMLQLIKHFGDLTDDGVPCGSCDRCRPADALLAVTQRAMSETERRAAVLTLAALSERDDQAVGRLFENCAGPTSIERRDFERVLAALAQANWVRIREDSFEKDGRKIPFRKVLLTSIGAEAKAADLAEVTLADAPARAGKSKSKTARKTSGPATSAVHREASPELFQALKAWRLAEARKKGVPAFRILTDKVLEGISALRPRDEATLLNVKGMGPKLAATFGPEIIQIVSSQP